MTKLEAILLGHGAGGRMTRDLVRDVFLPRFSNPFLETLTDSALLDALPPGRPALTTDAFVVDPHVFPGGDLGYLSVCGTVNDLAVAGARPLFLTFALILEEGLDAELLATIADGATRAAKEAGVALVAGDTKVVPRGKGDRAYAVTSGLGVVPPGRELGDEHVSVGDAIVASGPLGDHGATILGSRHELDTGALRSCCAPLVSLLEAVHEAEVDVHAVHDPTRGGVATTANEVAERAGHRMVLEESALPIRSETEAVCELLGLDPLYLACEGRALLWVAERDAERLLEVLHAHPQGAEATLVGRVEAARDGAAPVALRTLVGGERPLDLLAGLDLPRIC
jgi:hydrogenase expression/formation protein HypE